MVCQLLFSGKSKKNINVSSAESAQRVVKVNLRSLNSAFIMLDTILKAELPFFTISYFVL